MAKNNDRNRNNDDAARDTANMADVDTGEAVGTVGGGVAGAVVGSALGPLGTVAGGIVGAALGNKMGEGVADNDNDADERGE